MAHLSDFDPSKPLPPELLERFWKRVERRTDAECWPWRGFIQPHRGYGSFSFRGKNYQAHRLSLMVHGIAVPAHLDACHHCDNRCCVNPAHLYVGTRTQNMADCTARNRHNKPRGEKHWCAKLSAEQVRAIRGLRRSGATTIALAIQFNVHSATISRISRAIWRSEVSL